MMLFITFKCWCHSEVNSSKQAELVALSCMFVTFCGFYHGESSNVDLMVHSSLMIRTNWHNILTIVVKTKFFYTKVLLPNVK
jgi:hypothetical protein